ncbi:MAG: hypothetical protein M3Y59_15445 [Myxococcota bacterium]|nr:hypothetical protein [Myxococcota bacterium]
MSISEIRPRSPVLPVSTSPVAPSASNPVAPAAPDGFSPQPSHAPVPASAGGTPVPSNNFRATLSGPNPPHVGGGFFEGCKQANELRKLAGMAGDSVGSGGQTPGELAVEAKLRSLDAMPLDRGEDVTRAVYTSEAPGIPADALYTHFVQNPEAVFGAAGLSLRPLPTELRDGARVMIEDRGPPATWMPVEVRLNPLTREVRFETLDGHPLRGFNSFWIQDDGKGGARVNQTSDYQFSSTISKLGSGVVGGGEKQHQTWKAVHAHLFSAVQKDAVQW